MALSKQAEHRKRCDRCPVAQKKGDRATPTGQLLTKKVYERLKKRPAEPPQLGYPWNAAMEALYSRTKPPPTRSAANGRPGCALCLAKHSRNCTCGTELFDDHNPVKLDNFHCYVRGQNTPILCLDEPADQDEFKVLLAQLFRGCRAKGEAARRMAVFAGIGAVSGLPSVLETLLPHIAAGNDGEIVKGVREICRKAVMTPSKDQLFRGGQAHGTLSNAGAPNAVARLLQQEVPVLARLIAKASSDKEDKKTTLQRILERVPSAAKVMGGADYYQKRFVEIVLLGSLCESSYVNIEPKIVDAVFDLWPLAKGTRQAVRVIFPSAVTKRSQREAIRTLQKSLGGGRREVTMVNISALLCNWNRVDNKSMAGTYHKRRRL